MSPRTGPIEALVGFTVVQRNWGWFLALGIVQIVLGAIAIFESAFVTLVSTTIFGWLLLVGGAFSIVHAIWERKWKGFIIDLLTGLFYGIVGFMMVANPATSAASMALGIALFLIIGGAFRMVEALVVRVDCPHGGWVFLNGVVTFALGVFLWRQWWFSGFWAIGLFIGIEMLLYGWSSVMLAIAARKMSMASPAAAG